MELIILPDARKHGIADEDITHAVRNAIIIDRMDDEMTMHVGADRDGNLIEVGIVEAQDGTPLAVHAMEARPKYLR